MTLETLVTYIRSTNQPNYEDSAFILWLNEIESRIQTDVFLLAIESVEQHTELSESLLIDDAHVIVYRLYLRMQIALERNQFEEYQNLYKLFSAELSNYKIWYINNYHPADGKAEANGYYLTAYSIATKYGFSGSEADWIAEFAEALSAAAALGSGVSGTFTTADGKTVTVTGGVINAID